MLTGAHLNRTYSNSSSFLPLVVCATPMAIFLALLIFFLCLVFFCFLFSSDVQLGDADLIKESVVEYSDSETSDNECEEPVELSEYEREKNKRISENNEMLRKLGLISNEKTSHETVDKDLLQHLVET